MTSRTRKKTNTSTEPVFDPVTAYALAVTNGEIVAGPHVRATCKRHLDDLETGPARGLFWDVEKAIHVIGFFSTVLRLNGGAFEGVPFTLLSWQAFIIGSIFGWKRTVDGMRRFRVAFIESGKGSGKSPLAAGVGIYMTCADKESRAEVYSAAYKKDQAKVLFRDATAMVELSPDLLSRLRFTGRDEKTSISNPSSDSFFKPISTEERGRGQSGPRPHCSLLDEIHEHATNAMVEFLSAGTKGRRQPLTFMITNSGSDRESVCWDYHNYAVNVADRTIEDDSFFSYVCALDEEDKVRGILADDPFKDRSCWIKANPSLGVTISEEYLEKQVREARGIPSKQNFVLRLNFCRWTDSHSAWITKDVWDKCEATLDLATYRGRQCVISLDLSSRKDLTALTIAFTEDDGSVSAFTEYWTPKDTLKDRADQDRVPYDVWVTGGYLHAIPGKAINYQYVAKRLGELSAQFEIVRVVYDRWRIEELKMILDAEGITLPLEPFGQGFKDMSPAVDCLENLILNNLLHVDTNPVMRWNVASVVMEEDAAGNRKFTKRRATGRIDGVVTLAMAAKGLGLEQTEHDLDYKKGQLYGKEQQQ